MKKHEIIVMLTMGIIIVTGVIYSVATDWSMIIKNLFLGIRKICKDLIPLASIVFVYYLGRSSSN